MFIWIIWQSSKKKVTAINNFTTHTHPLLKFDKLIAVFSLHLWTALYIVCVTVHSTFNSTIL